MDIKDINFVLNKIHVLEESANCNLCYKNFVNPMRLKPCGHYFCYNCLQKYKNKHTCPKCNSFYEGDEIVSCDVVRDTDTILKKMKQIFDSVENNTSNTLNLDNIDMCNNEISYSNKQYRVIFFEETHHKINAKGESRLHIACRKKKITEVISLLDNNVDINMQDYAGWTPLVSNIKPKFLVLCILQHSRHLQKMYTAGFTSNLNNLTSLTKNIFFVCLEIFL